MSYCDGDGLLLVVKDDDTNSLHACCDKYYQEFGSPKDIPIKKSFLSPTFNNISVSLEEALDYGWQDYIYILKRGNWLKYADKSKVLF